MKKQFGQSWNIITNLKLIINHLIDNHIWKQIVEPNYTSRALKPAFNWFINWPNKNHSDYHWGESPKKPRKNERFQAKNWRSSGKNKSNKFHLYIIYSSGRLYFLLQKWISLIVSLIWNHGCLFSLKKTKGHISHVWLCLFTDVWLLALKVFP